MIRVGHLVRDEPWGVVDLDLEAGHVFVRQDWRYEWISDDRRFPWTMEEREHYHRAVDHIIWARWSLQARIEVRGTDGGNNSAVGGALVSQFGGPGLSLTFDVRSVVGPAHWSVKVSKVPANMSPRPRAWTNFAKRTVELFNIDAGLITRRTPGKPIINRFSVIAHEFGHTIGYANPRGHMDDYEPNSPYRRDTHSIMNVGRQIRSRHLSLITETLTTMVPGCTFQAVVVPR